MSVLGIRDMRYTKALSPRLLASTNMCPFPRQLLLLFQHTSFSLYAPPRTDLSPPSPDSTTPLCRILELLWRSAAGSCKQTLEPNTAPLSTAEAQAPSTHSKVLASAPRPKTCAYYDARGQQMATTAARDVVASSRKRDCLLLVACASSRAFDAKLCSVHRLLLFSVTFDFSPGSLLTHIFLLTP